MDQSKLTKYRDQLDQLAARQELDVKQVAERIARLGPGD